MIFCQTNSNSAYPKTVTGVVDFGNGVYTVITQEQKSKIVKSLVMLDDCKEDAISDSILISKFQQKEKNDSLALSLCIKERDICGQMIEYSNLVIKNHEKRLDLKEEEIEKLKRKERTQKLFKNLGTGLGTTFGLIGGFASGYLISKL